MSPIQLQRANLVPDAKDADTPSAHAFRFRRLGQEEEFALGDFAGQVVLIVNVASACAYTPQYRDLEALYLAKREKGLVVLGLPSNDFGAQEAGTEPEIQGFCAANYGVTFPMAGKIEITGPGRHPLYDWVEELAGRSSLPRWNFHKLLIGKRGELIDSFPSNASPLGPEMMGEICRALSAEN